MYSKRIDIVSVQMVRERSVKYSNRKVSSPRDCYEIFRPFLENADREKMVVCCLNTQNEPTSINIAHIGSLNSTIVHPREIFKTAILSNACSIIIAHCHPSGNTKPSKEDINMTARLKDAGEILGITLLDHLIVGSDGFLSLKEEGLL